MVDQKLLRIIEGAIQGDEQSFKKLLDARAKNVLYTAIKMMGDQHDGKDAAQEALLRIKHSIHKLQSPEAFDVWMYRIVFGACMDMKRKMKRTTTDVSIDAQAFAVPEMRQEFLPHEYVERKEERVLLMAAVRELPEKYRACLLLYYFEDFSYAEIAAALDIPVTDVTNRLNRAKKKLRKLLEKTSGAPIDRSDYGMAALPVLTEAFRIDADALVSQDAVDKLKEAVLAGVGVVAATSLSFGVVAKGVAAGLVGLAVVGGAWFLLASPISAQPDAVPMKSSSAVSPNGHQEPLEPESKGESAGEGEAESSEAIDPVDPADSADAADSSLPPAEADERSPESDDPDEPIVIPPEAKPVRDAVGVTATYQYRVFMLDEESTRTLYIERTSQSGDRVVVQKTGPLGMEPPSGIGIIEAFSNWQGGMR